MDLTRSTTKVHVKMTWTLIIAYEINLKYQDNPE